MKVEISNNCTDYNSYRSARVKSLFNAEKGYNFSLEAELDIDELDWQIGLVVGPSGSGKTSIGKMIFGENKILDLYEGWEDDKPIIDCIAPDGDFDDVTASLSAVGLGDVPSWLRPFKVLSNGEQFRAAMAKMIVEGMDEVVIDEFTSVVDRQIAKIGSTAFAKSWRRKKGNRVVLLSPHYDIVDWLEPDWIYDTGARSFSRDCRRRPKIELKIFKTNSSYWRFFKPHYYLDLAMPPAAEYFVGTVDGELACHVAVAPFFTARAYRATRLVVMPEWQGAGVGTRFLEWICQFHLEGNGRKQRQYPTLFHTSHPQLCSFLRRSKNWVHKSANLFGCNKVKSIKSIRRAGDRKGKKDHVRASGFGGHMRAVQGFKYVGNKRPVLEPQTFDVI